MAQPEVLTGAREPRSVRGFSDPSKQAPGPAGIPEGKRVFKFTHNRYRLQLTAPRDEVLPDGRIQRGKKAIVVVADDRVKILDSVKDAETIEMLENHPSYGTDFWDFARDIEAGKKVRREQAVKALQDPEERAAIVAALQESGVDIFPLPKSKEPAGSNEKAAGQKAAA